jgi:hypothetical protein
LLTELLATTASSNNDGNDRWYPGVALVLMENLIAAEGDEESYEGKNNDAYIYTNAAWINSCEGGASNDTVDDDKARNCGKIQDNWERCTN